MQLFPKSHKRKKTKVPLRMIIDGEEQIVFRSIVGVERTPLVVHRKASVKGQNIDTFSISRDKWTITHVFSGFNLGVNGSYEFCAIIANRLLQEPILYLPTAKMMSEHPDYSDTYQLISSLKNAHWSLGGRGS